MRPDNTAHLVTAAKQRHELTRTKALCALRELDRAGAAITFETVAHAAHVSRSWLYTQPDIRAEIQRLRHATQRASSPSIPANQRTSDASLLRRLQATTERNRQLAKENQQLRRRLAQALGQQRAATAPTPAPAPHKGSAASRSSVTIGPC